MNPKTAEPGQTPPEPPVVVRLRGLRKRFGKVAAVDGLDLTVQAGEIYGFLGVNGAGKTTALRVLMGIIKADEGGLELWGVPTRRTSIRQKQSIGYVSQEQTFYPWMTCRALGRFVGGLYPGWDAAEFGRLLQVLDLPPERKVSQLSGGMRVKLALALALAPRPPLLVLDEPTSGLDPLARREFLNIIKEETRLHQRTTLFSSHILQEVERVADRVGIIHRGRMFYEGTLEELRASVRLVQSQLPIQASGPIAPAPPTPSPELGFSGGPPAATLTEAISHEPAQSPSGPGIWVVPSGFEVLQDETREGRRSIVLRAPPAAWQTFDAPGFEIRSLSVEDAFVALVGKGAIVA